MKWRAAYHGVKVVCNQSPPARWDRAAHIADTPPCQRPRRAIEGALSLSGLPGGDTVGA
jgi:hypothetical protein